MGVAGWMGGVEWARPVLPCTAHIQTQIIERLSVLADTMPGVLKVSSKGPVSATASWVDEWMKRELRRYLMCDPVKVFAKLLFVCTPPIRAQAHFLGSRK